MWEQPRCQLTDEWINKLWYIYRASWWLSGKRLFLQCWRHRRCGFNPWARKIPWSRKWEPIPVFLPEKFHGQRSLVVYSSWNCIESDMTESTHKKWVHTYSGILLSHKQEWIWVSWSEVDESRTYCTEWRKSEREKQISYINAYIWNLENGTDEPICRTGIEKQIGEGEGGINWENSNDIYTLPHVK